MIPTFYSMGYAHPTGELPCKDKGPATPEFPCQPIIPHSYQVKSVTSFSGTNPQQSTPSSLQQLFLAYPEIYSPPYPQITNVLISGLPLAPLIHPHSHHRMSLPGAPWPIGKPMGPPSRP